MTDEKNGDSAASNSFTPIRDFLEGGYENRKISIGILATAIEKEDIGIYTWDRFGRLDKADKTEEERILDFLARIYKYENDPDAYRSDEHPLDYTVSFPWEDPFSLFGWPIDEMPDFGEIARLSNKTNILPPKPPQVKAGDTKKQNTYMLIIGALCRELGIDYRDRGIAPKIQGMVGRIGCNLDDGTIREVLKNVETTVTDKMK